MKKKPQTAASLDLYSSGSIIGNDPYSMMRRSQSSSSNGSNGPKTGSSTPNFGNMFSRVNSMFGTANSRGPTSSTTSPTLPNSQQQVHKKTMKENNNHQDEKSQKSVVSSGNTSKNNQKNTKPTTNKHVVETEYESTSENDSFNLNTLEDFDFSDDGGDDTSPSVVVVKKVQQPTVKEPTKNTPSPTPVSTQSRQPVQSQPVKKPEQPKSKPFYREPVVQEMEDLVLSEEEDYSGDDFSDFGDDDEVVDENNDDIHNTSQEASFDDFEEEIVDDNEKFEKNDKEEDVFSDFEDNESFEDNYFENSNEGFDDFEDSTAKSEPMKVVEPIVNNKPVLKPEPKKVEPSVPQKLVEKESVMKLDPKQETIRKVSSSPSPSRSTTNTKQVIEEPRTKLKSASIELLSKPKQERSLEQEDETAIERETHEQIEVKVPENKENVRNVLIEQPLKTKPKEVQNVSIGTDDLSKDSRTYATQTAYHSQVFNTNSQVNNGSTTPPPNACCEHCNCNLYSPNFVPYYPPPLAYFRQPYAQAFPQRPLSSFSTFPRSYIPPSFTSKQPHPTCTPNVCSSQTSTQTVIPQPKTLFTRATGTDNPIEKEKINFAPYIPNTRYIDEKNERANQQYQRFKDSFSSKLKESTSKATSQINGEHQRQTGFIRQELEEIKSLLLSSRQEMSMLLYNSRITPSNISAYPTTSPFEMK